MPAAIEHDSEPVSATGAALRTEPQANDCVSPENTTLNLSAHVGVPRPFGGEFRSPPRCFRKAVETTVSYHTAWGVGWTAIDCKTHSPLHSDLTLILSMRWIGNNRPQNSDRRTCAEAKRAKTRRVFAAP